jgi:hypothetical protein
LSCEGNPGSWRTDVAVREISVSEKTTSAAAAVEVPAHFGRPVVRAGWQSQKLAIRILAWVLTILVIIVLLPLLVIAAHILYGPGPDFASRGNHMTPHGSRPVA